MKMKDSLILKLGKNNIIEESDNQNKDYENSIIFDEFYVKKKHNYKKKRTYNEAFEDNELKLFLINIHLNNPTLKNN